jgi:hypothetical protein
MTLKEQMKEAGLVPCEKAVNWLGDRDLITAWSDCERPDWMLWLVTKAPELATQQQLVLCACKCARLVLHYVSIGEERPRLAIEVAERWLDNSTAENADAACDAACDAADAAYDAYAAYADAHAADAAAHAAYAAARAARAASAVDVAYAAYAARATYTADASTQKQMAEIIRSIITVS